MIFNGRNFGVRMLPENKMIFPLSKNAEPLPVHFRFYKKNGYSYAALLPVVPTAGFTKTPLPGIMLYSFSTAQKDAVFEEVKAARENQLNSFFIAGGPHPSGAPAETLDYFDTVVIGEGEKTLPNLISAIQNTGFSNRAALQNALSHILGIAFKNATGQVIQTAAESPVDLDHFPCFLADNMWRPLEISRGCPHRCKFCQTPQLFGRQMRHRSVSEIVKYAAYYDDLRFISSNAFAYGGNGISAKPEKIKELLSSLSKLEGKRLFFGTFPSEIRPEFVTEDLIHLVQTHCYNDAVSIGAQSGSDAVLKEIGRGHTAEDVYSAAEICLDAGITPIIDFIIGFPSETLEDQNLTLEMIDWICRKKGEVRAHYLTPLPSTPFENMTPAPVHPEISKRLGKLALEGQLKGVWENMVNEDEI